MEHYLRNAAVMPAMAWDDLIRMLDPAHIYRYDRQRSLAQRTAANDEATRLQQAYHIAVRLFSQFATELVYFWHYFQCRF